MYQAMFVDFGRFCSILGDFSVGTLPKHTQFPDSWGGTEHYLKSALVHYGEEVIVYAMWPHRQSPFLRPAAMARSAIRSVADSWPSSRG